MTPARTVGVRSYSEELDGRGEPIPSWSAPADALVYGWAPAGTSEPFEVGRETITWDLDLMVPPGFAVAPRDRVVVLGDEYTIEGRLESYDFGPFGFAPGGRVRLKRVEG